MIRKVPTCTQVGTGSIGELLLDGSLGVLTLTALDGSVGHGGSDQADGADGIIVAGDDVVDLVGITVGVNDGDDGNVQLGSLSNGIALLAGVNDAILLYV